MDLKINSGVNIIKIISIQADMNNKFMELNTLSEKL